MEVNAEERLSSVMGGLVQEIHYFAFLFSVGEKIS